ncbi:hypothetical protein [Mycobacterium aquaticum]|nr:hypothetical protein [Mycobacterium aquaticum]
MSLRLTDDTLVRLAPGMYDWCMLLEFAFDGQPSDSHLIEAVLEHPRWRDDCMSPWTGPCEVHGPYRLETVTVEGFRRCTAAEAWEVLINWPATDLNPWVRESLLLSREIVGAWVGPLVASADEIYQLAVPREGNEHGAGWVVGARGFHEFIAIDRQHGRLTVIIATDD